MENNIKKMLEDHGYYLTNGHYKLSGGTHSSEYVQTRISLMDPKTKNKFRKNSIDQIRKENITAIAGFTVGGLLLADAIAKHTGGKPLIIGDMEKKEVSWLNEERITENSCVLLVDDILTTTSQIDAAIRKLEDINNVTEIIVLVAVDRSTKDFEIKFRDEKVRVLRCVKIPIAAHDRDICSSCLAGIPVTDLSNPEKDFISVVLTQPREKAKFILRGYEDVFKMQNDNESLNEMNRWKLWFPALLEGLPIARIKENSSMIKFINYLGTIGKEHSINPRVIVELVGQVISLSAIRVESRAIGCSIIVGDQEEICKHLKLKAKVELPIGISFEKLMLLVPYFDALLETNYSLVLSGEGEVNDFRKLNISGTKSHMKGNELVKFVTGKSKSIGIVLSRGRRAFSVYNNGRLEAVGELSERSGLWEFSRPIEDLDKIPTLDSNFKNLLLFLIDTSRELVAQRHGALFVIGNVDDLECTPPKVPIIQQRLKGISREDLIELAKLDGAVLISKNGELTQATVIITNQSNEISTDPQEDTMHGGSRKETAKRTSKEYPDGAVIYVSQNGAIEIYVKGKSWLVSETFSGLSRN